MSGEQAEPQVTFLASFYNGEDFVGRALESVSAQTRGLAAAIIVDDGSTDGTMEIVRDWSKSTPFPAEFLRTERAGLAGARNQAIPKLTTKYVAFLDADDTWYPEHLARAVGLMERSGDVAFQASRDPILTSGEVLPTRQPFGLEEATSGLSGDEFLRRYDNYFAHSALVCRVDRLREVGMYDPAMRRRQDLELWLRLIHGQTWSFDPRPAGLYQVDTPGALSRSIAPAQRYLLKGLLKNRPLYDGPRMDELIRAAARRVASSSLTDAAPEDRSDGLDEAWPHLSNGDRLIFGVARRLPGVFAAMNRLRRRRGGFTESAAA